MARSSLAPSPSAGGSTCPNCGSVDSPRPTGASCRAGSTHCAPRARYPAQRVGWLLATAVADRAIQAYRTGEWVARRPARDPRALHAGMIRHHPSSTRYRTERWTCLARSRTRVSCWPRAGPARATRRPTAPIFAAAFPAGADRGGVGGRVPRFRAAVGGSAGGRAGVRAERDPGHARRQRHRGPRAGGDPVLVGRRAAACGVRRDPAQPAPGRGGPRCPARQGHPGRR